MIHEQLSFFHNKINITHLTESRFEIFKNLCKDRKVLHVGCADSQYFNKDRNLHLLLSSYCKELDGVDIDHETIKKLNEIYPANYYTNLNDIQNTYDIIIVPEVIEHVLNVHDFLVNIFKIESRQYFLTVPNCQHYCKEMIIDENSSTEIIHPDHKYWFSPYTLYKCLNPFLDNKNIKMFYIEKYSSVAALIEQK